MSERVILLHPEAPPMPPEGAPCNGCGVCCAAEPCPLGVLVSARRHGACRALRWDDASRRHVCGMLAPDPAAPGLQRAVLRLLARPMRRWIAAGIGCDCSFDVPGRAAAASARPAPQRRQ